VSGPRQASPRRSAAGPRAPAAARRTRARTGAARAAHAPVLARDAAEHELHLVAEDVAAPVSDDRLSNWQLLLSQFDAFLRDPRLTLALKASVAKVAAGVRAGGAATLDALRRMALALGRIRIPFPRRVLLALLALALPLALLALLSSSDDERSTRRAAQPPARPAADLANGLSLPRVGMPSVRSAPAKVPQVRVALVLDRTYAPAALRRELRALSAWLQTNHAPATRVSLIDARSGRASAPLRAADLARARSRRARPGTTAAVRAAFARRQGRRLLVTLGSTVTPPGAVSTLRVATRPGAGTGSRSQLRLRRGGRARATIDERRANALAASIARAIMAISGQREQR
jgi:hypothetical protein